MLNWLQTLKQVGRWSTNGGGEYYAVGVGGALAGRGADLAIIDDPVSEQDALSATALDNIYEWYTSGTKAAFAAWRFDYYRYDTMECS